MTASKLRIKNLAYLKKIREDLMIARAVAEERERIAKEADTRAKRYSSDQTDRWGNGYGYAMSEFAAAIRKVKP